MHIETQHITRIACIGEVMIELVETGEETAQIGVAGDSFNTAVYLTKLLRGKGQSVSYVTAVGEDRYSARIIAQINQHGLESDMIERRADHLPGLYAISTDDTGERYFTYWRAQSAARTLFSAPCAITLHALDRFDLVYLSGITLAILPPDIRTALLAYLHRFKERGGLVAYDSNYRPRLWEDTKSARQMNADMWRLCNIALPSLDDEMALFGDASLDAVVTRLQGYGVRFGALKRGAEGPLSLGEQPAQQIDFSRPERIIDTTAAGDSFNAGFLAAICQGEGLESALFSGHELAVKIIQKQGAIVDI